MKIPATLAVAIVGVAVLASLQCEHRGSSGDAATDRDVLRSSGPSDAHAPLDVPPDIPIV
jgi:hypothetical protein